MRCGYCFKARLKFMNIHNIFGIHVRGLNDIANLHGRELWHFEWNISQGDMKRDTNIKMEFLRDISQMVNKVKTTSIDTYLLFNEVETFGWLHYDSVGTLNCIDCFMYSILYYNKS